jgi:diguanylate cyclase (GGDEF)-like protein
MRNRYLAVFAVCCLYCVASFAVLRAAIDIRRAPGTDAIAARITDLDLCAATLLVAGLIALAVVYAVVWAPMERAVRAQTDALERAATIDALTGLFNRHAFGERVARALAASTRHRRHGAMLMIDIDRFKRVNDTYGHAVGDRAIRELGARLAACVRADEFAGRLGGDEFAVFAPDVDAGLDAFVARIRAAVRFSIDVDGMPVVISTSVGVARFPADGYTIEALLGSADRALYNAKRKRRGSVGFASRPVAIA